MKSNRPLIAAGIILFGQGFTSSVKAELPVLEKKEWLGVFAGNSDSKVRVSVSAMGAILIEPIYKGEVRPYIRMPISWGVEVTMPNGKKVVHPVIPESLESSDKATDKLARTTIRGKFAGDAQAEVVIEQKRGVVSIGGRIVDPGASPAEGIRFHVQAQVLNFYGQKFIDLKNDPSAFEALVADDSLKLTKSDKKRLKFDFLEAVDLTSEEVSGAGIAEAEISLKCLDRSFIFSATGGSSIRLSNRKGGALHEGMHVNWSPIADKDLGASARLVIEVK